MSFEFRMGMNRTRFRDNLTAFNLFTIYAAQKDANVVACNRAVEKLTEHFDTRCNSFAGFVTKSNDFDRLVEFQHTAFNTTRSNCAASSDCENVFNRHKERFIGVAFRCRDIFVDSVEEFHNISFLFFVAFKSKKSGTSDNRNIIARKFVFAQKFADFHFDEFKKFFVVNLVDFVKENNDSGNADLASKQDMFASLGHRTIRSRNNEDCAVHLRRTGYHVFDIVGVTRTVNVRIVAFFGLVLNVRSVNRNAAFAFFRSLINVLVGFVFCEAFFRKDFGNSSSQSGFAVIDVTDCTNINVGFTAVKFLFCHLNEHSLILKKFF